MVGNTAHVAESVALEKSRREKRRGTAGSRASYGESCKVAEAAGGIIAGAGVLCGACAGMPRTDG